MITYDRLWETMKKRGITQYHLIKREKFSAGQIGRLKNNMTVSTQTLDTLCRLLSCRIEDIVTYIPDNGETLPEQNPAVESISHAALILMPIQIPVLTSAKKRKFQASMPKPKKAPKSQKNPPKKLLKMKKEIKRQKRKTKIKIRIKNWETDAYVSLPLQIL